MDHAAVLLLVVDPHVVRQSCLAAGNLRMGKCHHLGLNTKMLHLLRLKLTHIKQVAQYSFSYCLFPEKYFLQNMEKVEEKFTNSTHEQQKVFRITKHSRIDFQYISRVLPVPNVNYIWL